MTREEIIKEAAAEHRDTVCCGFDDPIADAQEESFIEGAEWEHKRLVEKACGWLNSVDMRMYVIADHTSSNINRFDTNKFISDFRKAMEE